jgi:hypothetical protein
VFVFLCKDYTGIYDTFVVHESGFYIFGFGQGTDGDITSELVNFILDVAIDVCGVETGKERENV